MLDYQRDLAEVGKIPKENISRIIELVDEDIIIQSIAGLEDVLGDADVDADKVETVFYNIVRAKADPKLFIKLIDSTSELTTNQKDILKDAMKKIHNKVDINKIRANSTVFRLETFGHAYIRIDDDSITTEFRPISDVNMKKIIKIVPSLVIDTELIDRDKSIPINFQMSLDEAQQFVDALNKNINVLKTMTREMREKFGKDVI